MKRSRITLEQIADWNNLNWAAWRAARGKWQRPEVRIFFRDFERELQSLGSDIRRGAMRLGQGAWFSIRDPKPRLIHAPAFRERVLHHALMRQLGPVLDQSLVADTYACRIGRGVHAAVHRTQDHLRRWPWFAKLDVAQYFASIRHEVLGDQLRRKIKSAQVLLLIEAILEAGAIAPGLGLPIGTLTSQCFANFYLGSLDRFLLEAVGVPGYVRYMDDFLVWGHSRAELVRRVREATVFAHDRLQLRLKPVLQLARSESGATFCGYRVFPGRIWLAASRRGRYRLARRRWERAYCAGEVDGDSLQRGYDAAVALTLPAECRQWRGALEDSHPEWQDEV